ncbi:GNAT family N-acetyltransferase [Kocuria sp.]|uniref:GNAT family N-acetyltransferase n=1 Tax=Kocuria sp. TaxID=1871328 RepID=UPI0026DD866B|nr:GNAT family N-acetyltransferase [Kocuria sp.]MDO4919046.1 GNAT family N-acetyltransferase [Kocuria sp.]
MLALEEIFPPFGLRITCGDVELRVLRDEDFPVVRTVTSGSWLGRSHHGQGIGTLMRQMAMAFAFDELGALACHSEYVVGNHASAAVSRKTGYVANGRSRIVQHTRDGAVGTEEQRVVVTPATFIRPEAPVVCEGTEALGRFFGIERPRDGAHHPLPPS